MMSTGKLVWLWLLLGSVLLAGCSESEKNPAGKIQVFTGVAPVGYLAQRIGGEQVEARTLIPPGRSAHEYSPSPTEIKALQHVDLYFKIGLPLEKAVLDKALSGDTSRICDITGEVTKLSLAETEGGHHHDDAEVSLPGEEDLFDQHIWLSIDNCRAMARAMAARYEQFDPHHADLYRQNLAALDADLQDAKKILAEQLAPFAGRTFLVYHPAYGYFAHEFQLRQKAIEYDGKPPTAKQLSELKKEQALSGAGILFSQPQTNSTLVDNVAAALQCKVVVLDPLAENILDNFHQLALAFAEEFQKESHDE